MGREVRRVPANWEHPKEWRYGRHDFIPFHDRSILKYYEAGEDPPEESEFMPDWKDEERTHYQMYEDTTEGTPISPVMATPEELARWLADNGASSFGRSTATYEQWLGMIEVGCAPSLVFDAKNGLRSGVESISENTYSGTDVP